MKYRVFIESRLFTRIVGDYLDDDSYAALQQRLIDHPTAGPVVRDSGGVRKIRWAATGKGKSGGVRVIYYIDGEGCFWMLTIYRKGEVDAIPGRLLRKIKEAVQSGKA